MLFLELFKLEKDKLMNSTYLLQIKKGAKREMGKKTYIELQI